MQWENLTYIDFKNAIKDTKGVCILPLGVIEKHGDHLPLGTDIIVIHKIACLAAEREPAVVFPYYYFTQILEAKHQVGTIAIKPELMLKLLENVCDEIGRNGFKKIILLNGHGGNTSFLLFYLFTLLNKKKPYTIYYPREPYEKISKVEKVFKTEDAHAGERETSIVMAIREDLVKKGYIPQKPAKPLGRLKHLEGMRTPVNWYADYPDHYAGDARFATKIKGEKVLEMSVDYVSKVIKLVKKDKITKELYEKFFRECIHT